MSSRRPLAEGWYVPADDPGTAPVYIRGFRLDPDECVHTDDTVLFMEWRGQTWWRASAGLSALLNGEIDYKLYRSLPDRHRSKTDYVPRAYELDPLTAFEFPRETARAA